MMEQKSVYPKSVYPFEIIKKGLEHPIQLPTSLKIELQDFEAYCLDHIAQLNRSDINRFIWDGARFYWQDLEAGNLEIDFTSKKLQYRMQKLNKAQEPLLRAVGWKSTERQRIWDLTAGLGRDSALLYFAGLQVLMFERNPVLQTLLQYALTQLSQPAKYRDIDTTTEPYLYLMPQDAIAFLQNRDHQETQMSDIAVPLADVIYMDPMYPERKKSALVKKELRIIRNLVGADLDNELLLKNALTSGVPRVVVKRPKGAEFVADLKPSHSVESPNTRFDVYLQHSLDTLSR